MPVGKEFGEQVRAKRDNVYRISGDFLGLTKPEISALVASGILNKEVRE